MILPLRLPGLPGHAGVEGHAQLELRIPSQPGALGGARPVARGTLASSAILGVNLWLGFPLHVLSLFWVPCGRCRVTLKEPRRSLLLPDCVPCGPIKLPLVLQSTVPLLIASFAFSATASPLIYMLTGGVSRLRAWMSARRHPDFDGHKVAIESGSRTTAVSSSSSWA